jgi:hypothetical protein
MADTPLPQPSRVTSPAGTTGLADRLGDIWAYIARNQLPVNPV